MEPNEDIRKLATLVRKYFRLDHCTLCIKFYLNGEKLKPLQRAAVTWIFLNHGIEYVKVLLNKLEIPKGWSTEWLYNFLLFW